MDSSLAIQTRLLNKFQANERPSLKTKLDVWHGKNDSQCCPLTSTCMYTHVYLYTYEHMHKNVGQNILSCVHPPCALQDGTRHLLTSCSNGYHSHCDNHKCLHGEREAQSPLWRTFLFFITVTWIII